MNPSMYMCTFAPGWFYPGRIHRWRQRGSAGRGGDFSNGSERLLQGSMLLEHFNSVLLLLWWLIHQSWAFSQSVELGQELRANELLNLQRGIINYCEKLKCNFVKWYFILIQKNESTFLRGGKKCIFPPGSFFFLLVRIWIKWNFKLWMEKNKKCRKKKWKGFAAPKK